MIAALFISILKITRLPNKLVSNKNNDSKLASSKNNNNKSAFKKNDNNNKINGFGVSGKNVKHAKKSKKLKS